MELNTLKDLLVEQLKDLHSAETQLTEALPKMAEAATNPDLKKAFKTHLEETKGQLERLKKIGAELDVDLGGHKCKAMEGLIKEGDEMRKEDGDNDVIDAGLIACAQRVEHYEIAGYGTARVYAEQLGHKMAYDLLSETLEQEKDTDVKLTVLAVNCINRKAEASH